MLLLQRRNIVKIAAVIALLLAAFFPAKYINSIYGYLPGVGLLSLMLLSVLYFLIIRRSIRFDAETFDAVCQRGETVNAVLKIVNRSVLTCPKARAFFFVSDFFGEEDSASPKTFAMRGKSGTEFPFGIKTDHIGVYTIGVKMLQIYDPLGIFSITIRAGRTFQITVLPKVSLTEEIQLKERLLTDSRNVSKSTISDGFDYTGVREYALGDSMKRIHWKLSAHSSAYMTRITESSKKSDLTVVIDFVSASPDREILPNIYDCLVETALSLIEQAMSKDIEYSLLFIGRDLEINRVIPKGEQDYQNLVQMMPALDTNPDSDMLDGAEILDKESHLSNKSANVILCTSRVTEQLIQELIAVKQQQRNPELYYIIPATSQYDSMIPSLRQRRLNQRNHYILPSGLNCSDAEDPGAPLGDLDDFGIRYHLVPAEAMLQQCSRNLQIGRAGKGRILT